MSLEDFDAEKELEQMLKEEPFHFEGFDFACGWCSHYKDACEKQECSRGNDLNFKLCGE